MKQNKILGAKDRKPKIKKMETTVYQSNTRKIKEGIQINFHKSLDLLISSILNININVRHLNDRIYHIDRYLTAFLIPSGMFLSHNNHI